MSSACPEYGFELKLHLAGETPTNTVDAIIDAFITHIEILGLSAGGGGSDDEWHFVISRVGAQAIDADRGALERWARNRSGIRDVTVGPLLDLTEDLA